MTFPKNSRQAFTLIELLVVIAIISILAAILFPVFASAREKAKESTCVSNVKQIMLGYLQYTQDNDEVSPIAFGQTYLYGSSTAYADSLPGYGNGVETGIQQQLQPYIKSQNIFQCPDDYSLSTAQASAFASKLPIGTTATSAGIVGNTAAQIWGSSYQFTHEAETNPFPNATTTGYATSCACGSISTTSITNPKTNGASECDIAAHNESLAGSYGNGWLAYQANAASDGTTWAYATTSADAGAPGFQTVTAADYTRPAETRVMHEWQVNWVESPAAPSKPAYHPLGEAEGFEDGHCKFVIKYADYNSGCDGVDFAWDNAGSCNIRGLQRAAD